MGIEGTVKAVEEDVIRTWLQRHKNGLLVRFKVAPEVEEFFRSFSGYAQSCREYGPAWLPLEKGGASPRVWDFKAPTMSEGQYSLNNIGEALMLGNNPSQRGDGSKLMAQRLVNISFLRMEGASSENGSAFVVDTIISRPEMEELSNAITRACGLFYGDYIKQVQFDIRVTCQPTQMLPWAPPQMAAPAISPSNIGV